MPEKGHSIQEPKHGHYNNQDWDIIIVVVFIYLIKSNKKYPQPFKILWFY